MKNVIKDKEIWDKTINSFPESMQDIYYTFKHYKISSYVEDGNPEAFYYEEGDSKFFYPYFINEIKGYKLDNCYYDIQTPYGYGGPLINCSDSSFLERAENAFMKHCKEINIVCEFIRFHPLFENHKLFNQNIVVIPNRVTVYVDLTKSIEHIWENSLSTKNRNVIKKAEKSNLKVIRLDDIDDFKEIYLDTMKRINADNFYYFNDDYFKLIAEDDRYVILGVEYEEKLIACGIFISSGDYFHYHLAGSLKDYLKLNPNNLMIFEAIKLGKEFGKKIMFLGGGLQNSIEDSLFKFKASFSKSMCDFYIGKRIHNKGIYDYLISEWEKKNGKKSNILLQYRY